MQSEQRQATDLRGKVAMVTGASSGIGEAIAQELVQRGAHVALFARRENRLQALAQRLVGKGSEEPLIVPGDVRKPEDVQHLVNQTVQRWGKLDIVIANAGVGYRAYMRRMRSTDRRLLMRSSQRVKLFPCSSPLRKANTEAECHLP